MTSPGNLRVLIVALIMMFAIFGSAHAQETAPDAQAFQRIISSQIEAFRRDEGLQAFSFASPGIKQQFGTAANFMAMVRQGYPQVYRPRSFKFGKITTEMGGRPTQRVHITDNSGQNWTALYAFEQQPDGTWRISGVVVLRQADMSA